MIQRLARLEWRGMAAALRLNHLAQTKRNLSQKIKFNTLFAQQPSNHESLCLYRAKHLKQPRDHCPNMKLNRKQQIRITLHTLRTCINSKTIRPHEITDILDIADFIENGIGRIMVGCSRSTYPSNHLSL